MTFFVSKQHLLSTWVLLSTLHNRMTIQMATMYSTLNRGHVSTWGTTPTHTRHQLQETLSCTGTVGIFNGHLRVQLPLRQTIWKFKESIKDTRVSIPSSAQMVLKCRLDSKWLVSNRVRRLQASCVFNLWRYTSILIDCVISFAYRDTSLFSRSRRRWPSGKSLVIRDKRTHLLFLTHHTCIILLLSMYYFLWIFCWVNYSHGYKIDLIMHQLLTYLQCTHGMMCIS